jgi:hypothetical protein
MKTTNRNTGGLELRRVSTPEMYSVTGIPRFTSLIRNSKIARKAKTRKTKINFLLLPEKGCRVQRSVCERAKNGSQIEKQVLICASRISENS